MRGLTSTQFVKKMEKAQAKPFGDKQVIGIDTNEFKNLVMTSNKISNFAKRLRKEKRVTEFGTGYATRMLLQMQRDMSKTDMFLEALAGGFQKSEVKKINEAQKERASKTLSYIG